MIHGVDAFFTSFWLESGILNAPPELCFLYDLLWLVGVMTLVLEVYLHNVVNVDDDDDDDDADDDVL